MGESEPVSERSYPIVMKHYDRVGVQVIHSSHSSWSAPIIVVPKGDGEKCLVINYRALNKVTQKFICPMPKVEDIFQKLKMMLSTSQYLISALGTIIYPSMKILFPKQLLHLLSELLSSWRLLLDWYKHWHFSKNWWRKYKKDFPFTIAYLDDIIICSKTAKEHLDHLQEVSTNIAMQN